MDLERAVEFCLEQQIRLAAGLDEVRHLLGRVAQQQMELTQHVNHFQQEISTAVLAIAEQQKLLAAAQAHLAAEQARLAEQVRHTEERLNALIDVVDGIVRRRPPQ